MAHERPDFIGVCDVFTDGTIFAFSPPRKGVVLRKSEKAFRGNVVNGLSRDTYACIVRRFALHVLPVITLQDSEKIVFSACFTVFRRIPAVRDCSKPIARISMVFDHRLSNEQGGYLSCS